MLQPVIWGGGIADPPSAFRRNFEVNIKRGLEEIVPGEVKTTPLYIVCSGPSLEETWHELKDRPGEIWALNAAFDWLCKKGIRPDYGVCLASEPAILQYFHEVQPGDKFLFGSMTNTDLVDRTIAKGGAIKLFHVACPEDWDIDMPVNCKIHGAGTVGSRSFDLAWILGWRDVHVLGMDASLSMDMRIAVDRPMWEDQRHLIRTFVIGGRAFVAMPSHARQVDDLYTVLKHLEGMEVTFYGDGMMQWAMHTVNQRMNNAAQ